MIKNVMLRAIVSGLMGMSGVVVCFMFAGLLARLAWGGDHGHAPAWFMPVLMAVSAGVLIGVPLLMFSLMTPKRSNRGVGQSPNGVPMARPLGGVSAPVFGDGLSVVRDGHEETVSVTCQLNDDDMLAMFDHFKRRSPLVRRLRVVMVCIVLGMLAYTSLSALTGTEPVREKAIGAVVRCLVYVFVVGGILGVIRWYERYSRARILRTTNLEIEFAPTMFTVTPDAFLIESMYESSRTPWRLFSRISRNEEYIILAVSHIRAHLVPLRAFASAGDADRFFELAERHWSENAVRSPEGAGAVKEFA